MPEMKTGEELRDHQLKRLKWTVTHAYNGSSAYKKKMDDAGVKPGEIHSLDDLKRLPFTTSTDLQEGYPFPLLSVPFDKVVRIHASSGTTGEEEGALLHPERY